MTTIIPTASPSPPPRRNKRACIPASTNAILDLKEMVPSTAIMGDDGCAICFKALTADQVVHDDKDDATEDLDDDLKALAALVANQDAHQEEEDDDDDNVVVDEKKAMVTWLRPLRLRVMPCSHVFHQHCIFKWLTRNTICPLCRYKLPTTDHDDDDNEDFWFPSVPDIDDGSWEEENEGASDLGGRETTTLEISSKTGSEDKLTKSSGEAY